MANLYENEHYAVIVKLVGVGDVDSTRGYVVVNKATMVEEFTTKQYPEALVAAASLNRAIKDEVWLIASGEKQDPMIAEMERMMGGGGPKGGGLPPMDTFN